MEMRAYQQWLEAWDKARGWDRVSPSHTLIHAMEELGEVARLLLQWEGYKPLRDGSQDAESPARIHAELEEELSDVFVFLFKLAYQTGVDVEAALVRGQAKADGRYDDLAQARAMLDRYHARQIEALNHLLERPDRADDNRGSIA
jgi:NTP pyrophosphatase (non-canonical NTP hydrolase)